MPQVKGTVDGSYVLVKAHAPQDVHDDNIFKKDNQGLILQTVVGYDTKI